jgi:hypothetical protein
MILTKATVFKTVYIISCIDKGGADREGLEQSDMWHIDVLNS